MYRCGFSLTLNDAWFSVTLRLRGRLAPTYALRASVGWQLVLK